MQQAKVGCERLSNYAILFVGDFPEKEAGKDGAKDDASRVYQVFV